MFMGCGGSKGKQPSDVVQSATLLKPNEPAAAAVAVSEAAASRYGPGTKDAGTGDPRASPQPPHSGAEAAGLGGDECLDHEDSDDGVAKGSISEQGTGAALKYATRSTKATLLNGGCNLVPAPPGALSVRPASGSQSASRGSTMAVLEIPTELQPGQGGHSHTSAQPRRRASQVFDQHEKGFFDFSELPTRPDDGGLAEPIIIVNSPHPVVDPADPWASLQSQYKVHSLGRDPNTAATGNTERDDPGAASTTGRAGSHNANSGGGAGGRGGGMREHSGHSEQSVGAGTNVRRRAAPAAAAAPELVFDDDGGGLRRVEQIVSRPSKFTGQPQGQRHLTPPNGRQPHGSGGWDQGNMAKAGTIMVDDDNLSDGLLPNQYSSKAGNVSSQGKERTPPPQKFNGHVHNNVGELGVEDIEDVDVDALLEDEMKRQGLSPELAAKFAAFDAMAHEDR